MIENNFELRIPIYSKEKKEWERWVKGNDGK